MIPEPLDIKVMFILAQGWGIIEPQMSKKGTETGIYLFKGRPIGPKGIKGRDKVINWFVATKSKERERILNELKRYWKSIAPNKRKEEFEKAKKYYEEILRTRKNLSEDLKNSYEEAYEIVERAIKDHLFEKNELVSSNISQ